MRPPIAPRRTATVLAALGALLATGCPVGASPAAGERVTRRFSARDVRSITVEATVGHIAVTGWPRDEVVVEVERRAPTVEAASQIPVTVAVEGGVLRVAARQAADGREADLVTDVTLRVPSLADVGPVDLFEGRISLQGLGGRVEARVERGRISGERLGGKVRLETVSGDIALAGARLDEGGLVRCRTFNGHVTLRFDAALTDARILALTLDGAITSNLPLSDRSGFGPSFREATLGAGTRLVSVDVVRGDISITVPSPPPSRKSDRFRP